MHENSDIEIIHSIGLTLMPHQIHTLITDNCFLKLFIHLFIKGIHFLLKYIIHGKGVITRQSTTLWKGR
jgi:hypothetical protein